MIKCKKVLESPVKEAEKANTNKNEIESDLIS